MQKCRCVSVGGAIVFILAVFANLCASLLEMMLESSLSDLREAQGVFLPFCPSLVRLLRLLQDFLFSEGTDNHALWSEKVYHITSHPEHIDQRHILFGGFQGLWNCFLLINFELTGDIEVYRPIIPRRSLIVYLTTVKEDC